MFLISKVIGALTQPANALLLAVLVGVVLLFTRRARQGRTVLSVVAGIMILLAVVPWEDVLIAPLEQRFPAPAALPDHIDGIITLGGAIDPELSEARGQPSLNGAAERLTAFVALGREHPEAKLVFTGGSGTVTAQEFKEAPVARRLLGDLGFDTGRVVFEGQSRNTRENATLSKEAVSPKPGEVWVLITSAAHMPRAIGCFRAVGWDVLPYPVDYTSSGQGGGWRFNLGAGLGNVGNALHEWLGLAYYRLRGWSESLFPRP